MDKNEVCQRISAVINTLDTGITVTGVQNAGNISGCYVILKETLDFLLGCDITPIEKEDKDDKK